MDVANWDVNFIFTNKSLCRCKYCVVPLSALFYVGHVYFLLKCQEEYAEKYRSRTCVFCVGWRAQLLNWLTKRSRVVTCSRAGVLKLDALEQGFLNLTLSVPFFGTVVCSINTFWWQGLLNVLSIDMFLNSACFVAMCRVYFAGFMLWFANISEQIKHCERCSSSILK
jgi:hypothetical protein